MQSRHKHKRFQSITKFTDRLAFFWGLIFTLFCSLAAFRENLGGIFNNRLPLAGDGSFTAIFLKLLKENSYWDLFNQNFHSDQLGWPNSINFTSFPVGNTLDLFCLKIFMSINPNMEISNLIHVVAILKVIPIYIATYWFCRKLRIWKPSAALCSSLFALSSYNLIRAEGHFFLALTWSVPLGLFLLIRSSEMILTNSKILCLNLRDKVELVSCSLLVGYSSFYYSFFFLFIGTVVLLVFIARELFLFWEKRDTQKNSFLMIKQSFSKFLVMIFSLLGIVLGLILQIVPVILHQMATLASTRTSDRSFTEPIVYGGTLQSLFFDFTKLVLHTLRREDILNFLRTQISWEGSQVGAFTGFFFLFLILVSAVSLSLGKFVIQIFTNISRIQLLFLFLIISLMLYFPSPFNFIINSYLPQIRAWGRISIIITLLVLTLSYLIVQSLQLNKYLAALLVVAIALPGFAEVASFRLARPPSIDISVSAASTLSSRSESLNFLQTLYEKNCPLSVIPITPFPEFDNPQDSAGDYAYFDLPLSDNGYFKWSNGAFKNTWDGRFLEPLFSQQPNFVRANLVYTISYLKQLGVCGAIIDRSSLIPLERTEFQKILQSNKGPYVKCAKALPGEIFENLPRFYSVNLRNSECKFREEKEANFLFKQNGMNNYVWRIDSPYSIGYNGGIQTFPVTTSIDFRLKLKDEIPGRTVGLYIKLFMESGIPQPPLGEICIISKSQGALEKCQKPIRFASGFKIEVLGALNKRELYEFNVSLKGSLQGISSWGIFPITSQRG